MADEASTCTSRRGGGVLISMPKKMEGGHERKKEREREGWLGERVLHGFQ